MVQDASKSVESRIDRSALASPPLPPSPDSSLEFPPVPPLPAMRVFLETSQLVSCTELEESRGDCAAVGMATVSTLAALAAGLAAVAAVAGLGGVAVNGGIGNRQWAERRDAAAIDVAAIAAWTGLLRGVAAIAAGSTQRAIFRDVGLGDGQLRRLVHVDAAAGSAAAVAAGACATRIRAAARAAVAADHLVIVDGRSGNRRIKDGEQAAAQCSAAVAAVAASAAVVAIAAVAALGRVEANGRISDRGVPGETTATFGYAGLIAVAAVLSAGPPLPLLPAMAELCDTSLLHSDKMPSVSSPPPSALPPAPPMPPKLPVLPSTPSPAVTQLPVTLIRRALIVAVSAKMPPPSASPPLPPRCAIVVGSSSIHAPIAALEPIVGERAIGDGQDQSVGAAEVNAAAIGFAAKAAIGAIYFQNRIRVAAVAASAGGERVATEARLGGRQIMIIHIGATASA